MSFKQIFAVTLFGLAALPASAQNIFSNPGLCAADYGEQELAGVAYLYSSSVEAHWRACSWSTPLDYAPGLIAEVNAQCDGQDGPDAVRLEIAVNGQGRVTIAGMNGSTGLPDYYFPCSRWGFKG
ncbi:hypothetical protein JQX09_19910 [Sulfitobacter pseudonitzschiae]|uniref:Uncharacterized protein n=1 Tax=Pseudosulfitobacter pseudonitzschiae TaxID=1402135 RepID=A0A9Q2NLJ0_9RHOB|nr:hypothetical protein [Pseudosulfitobacter pseudonitzschiae]MBM2294197.1 hypothetical protein [Pseudosulfitobacter pseudonitzschiae]MBM2299121.1 hypothetical protein [Pseudosulfitobacter pseudonitzschiae]MBM2304029.1 hypothetical protein [Pseudosulfitobacter pseudonitzschiae]MBM2313810.1 hypothetical protein [Pseudosulfitobacter pseudonitzschiae]MBM2318725.1 hypothetical protein [Pseudosulfitobacter pseudonitzschiae]